MNFVIETLTNHNSCRSYDDNKPVQDEHLEAIIQSARAAPSWGNAQHVSIIAVKDPERRRKMAELCGNQAHIAEAPVFLAFCADFYRTKLAVEKEGEPFIGGDFMEAILIGTTDVGIALANAIASAESLGLGTVPIGGIRRNSLEIIDMLGLPEYVIPISGLCIGHPKNVKPRATRLPRETTYFEERYNTLRMEGQSFQDYLESPFRDITWAKRMVWYYSNRRYMHTAKMLKQQGFICKDMLE